MEWLKKNQPPFWLTQQNYMLRANSYPNLIPESTNTSENYDDSQLEGVAAHIKLLLKLIHDHKDACHTSNNDSRRMLRVATMMTILDNVKDRIQKCQSFGNTQAKPNLIPKEKKPSAEQLSVEKDRLRKELSASLSARKCLENMCSSLGKEKVIMTGELSKKIYELRELEELMNDLKERNEMLLEKVQECGLEHKGKPGRNIALEEQNKVLSEKLFRSIDGYKSMKIKLKETKEENVMMRRIIDEMGAKVGGFKERLVDGSDPPVDVQEEIVALENMFECFRMMVDKKERECLMYKSEISVSKPSVLA